MEEQVCVDAEVYLTPEAEREITHRLSRIEGHVRGIRRMLAEHKDCDSLLVQVAAVKAAVSQVALKLLDGHMDT